MQHEMVAETFLFQYYAEASIIFTNVPYSEHEDNGPAVVTVEIKGQIQQEIQVRLTSEPSGDPNGATGNVYSGLVSLIVTGYRNIRHNVAKKIFLSYLLHIKAHFLSTLKWYLRCS